MISELEYRADCDRLSAAEMIEKYGIGCFTLVAEDFKPEMLPEHFGKTEINTKELLKEIKKKRRERLKERGMDWDY